MRYGFVLPGGDAVTQLEQAMLAEHAGWDGIFVWEGSAGVDAWTLLSAIAQRTSAIRLGTMLTPLPWRRPWKLASQAATLDQLSGGRAILTVGLGAVDGTSLGGIAEPRGRRVRAELLDEGLDIIDGIWSGRPWHSGEHYQVDLREVPELHRLGIPARRPRLPIWVVGAWPRPKSMRRVLRCDGIVPDCVDEHGRRDVTPDDIRAICGWLREQGENRPEFDVVKEGETPSDPAAAATVVEPWAAAGVTWWLDARWEMPHHSAERMRQVTERLTAGPPRAKAASP
jgi:hypothetical protein